MRAMLVVPIVSILVTVAGDVAAQPEGDRYLCYDARPQKADEPKRGPGRDQFGRGTVEIAGPRLVCNPVEWNRRRPSNPALHLVCYGASAKIAPPAAVAIANEFTRDGRHTLELGAPRLFCVPSAKRIAK